jgi:hypothetical protein
MRPLIGAHLFKKTVTDAWFKKQPRGQIRKIEVFEIIENKILLEIKIL